MNIITKVLLFTLALAVCQACSTGEANQNADVTDKVEAVDKVKTAAKQQQKRPKAKPRGPKSKATNTVYWETLAKEVNIDADKIDAIRSLNEKTNEEVRALRSQKAENSHEKSKQIRMAERKKVESILGAALFQKKMDFDKSWTTRNTKDFKKMGEKK